MSLFVDIEKKLGNFYLKVFFEAEKETLALLGASGCGKSMTLKCIAGIEKPTSGQILFDGQDITDMSITDRAKLGISYAFQQPVRFKGVTVF